MHGLEQVAGDSRDLLRPTSHLRKQRDRRPAKIMEVEFHLLESGAVEVE
jgi:hypothetical protein